MTEKSNPANSDIERILSTQVWKKRSRTTRNSPSPLREKLKIDCSKVGLLSKASSSPRLPPIKEDFLTKLKSATLSPLSPTALSSTDHSKRLSRLAIPYKTLASSLKTQAKTVKSNYELIKVPKFPKSPFGSHKKIIIPEFEDLAIDYTTVHDAELKANQIKYLAGRMKSEGLFATLMAKSVYQK